MPQTRIGISGWRYEPWRGAFYPKDLPQKRELEFASRQLKSIEINGTFVPNNSPSLQKFPGVVRRHARGLSLCPVKCPQFRNPHPPSSQRRLT